MIPNYGKKFSLANSYRPIHNIDTSWTSVKVFPGMDAAGGGSPISPGIVFYSGYYYFIAGVSCLIYAYEKKKIYR